MLVTATPCVDWLILSVRAILQNKKAAIEDLETRLANLKTDLISAFERQGIIEVEIRALREGELRSMTSSMSTHDFTCDRARKETETKA